MDAPYDETAEVPLDLGSAQSYGVKGPMWVVEHTRLGNDLPPEVHVVVGAAALSQFAVQIDWSHDRLRLLAGGRIAGTPYEPHGAVRVPLHLAEDGTPVIRASLDGRNMAFAVDTGSEETFLQSRSQVKRLHPSGELRYTRVRGRDSRRLLRLNHLTVGRAVWRRPVVFDDSRDDPGETSTLGTRFLQRFDLVVDSPGHTLYLTPRPGWQDATESWMGTGLVLDDSQRGRLLITELIVGSPAASAGLRPGDEIVEIGGKHVKDLAPEDLARVSSEATWGERPVVLKIRHSGESQSREVRLTPRKLL